MPSCMPAYDHHHQYCHPVTTTHGQTLSHYGIRERKPVMGSKHRKITLFLIINNNQDPMSSPEHVNIYLYTWWTG